MESELGKLTWGYIGGYLHLVCYYVLLESPRVIVEYLNRALSGPKVKPGFVTHGELIDVEHSVRCFQNPDAQIDFLLIAPLCKRESSRAYNAYTSKSSRSARTKVLRKYGSEGMHSAGTDVGPVGSSV